LKQSLRFLAQGLYQYHCESTNAHLQFEHSYISHYNIYVSCLAEEERRQMDNEKVICFTQNQWKEQRKAPSKSIQKDSQDPSDIQLLWIDIDLRNLLCFYMGSIIKHRPNSDHQIGGYELTFPTIEGAEPATLARNTKWLWLPFWQKCLHYLVLN
jgi:hypothetical protein